MKLNIKEKNIFMIGVGGIGMSALARLYSSYGISVTGYDDNKSDTLTALKHEGIKISTSLEEDLSNFDSVVYSSDVSIKHPLMKNALKLGIPLIKRGEALSNILNNTNSIAITGAHGKTTLTLLISTVLKSANMDPSVYAGGVDLKYKTNFINGSGNLLVAEMDESDATFLSATPKYTIITNIDHEHVTKYQNITDVIDTFSSFISNLSENSVLILNGDDINLIKMGKDVFRGKKLFFCGSKSKDNDYYYRIIKSGKSGMSLEINSSLKKFNIETSLIGEHHASNITQAVALFDILKLDEKSMKAGVKEFKGVKRRLEKLYSNDEGGEWYSDYGHHPVEINAVITAMNNVPRNGKLVAIFEAHRFSRLKTFFNDFVSALKKADFIILSDIYAASETGDSEKMIKKLKESIGLDKTVHLHNSEIYSYMEKNLKDNSISIIFSAGSLDYIIRKNIK